MMLSQIKIPSRFRGPIDSANGGYTCGVLSGAIEGTTEVTLRHPPPINKFMEIKQTEENNFVLYGQDKVIAEAKPAELELVPPRPPNFEAAERSSLKEEEIKDHYFPECFVCGPKRKPGDGLRIFPGPVKDKAYLAAAWIPDNSLSDEKGYIRNEFVWSALDCPSGWAIIFEKMRFIVLGRLVVQIYTRVKPNNKFIVMGWKLSEEGRKIYAGAALYSADGQLYAKGKATWIEIRQE
jgi:hypothetical protein